jgi:peptidoglycan/LPS O-acetylase OafA/YrhL
MRWRPSGVHPTSGSARVFGASDWTLVDGGFRGASLVPLSVVSVAVAALAAVATRLDRRMWWAQITTLALSLYYPFWVLYVFAKKWEDDVFPAEGLAVLALAFAAMVAGSLSAVPNTNAHRPTHVVDP